MEFSKIIRREIEVAFSRHSQSIGFRILKYIVLGCIIYIFWGNKLLWPLLLAFFTIALLIHFWYRYKTAGWTKSYGGWNYEKNKSKLKDE